MNMRRLRKCECGCYTLAEKCVKCGKQTASAHPPKFSFQDKYAKYRRKSKFGME